MAVPPTPRRRRSPLGVGARLLLFVVVAVVAGLVAAGMALPLVGGAGVAARATVDGFESLPTQLETPPLPQRTVIRAADGSPLATIYYQNRVEVPLSKVALVMREAIVAIEDSRFLDHRGIDLRGTLRAVATNSGAGGVQQGGSTLTMQYVKNVLLNNAKTDEEVRDARARSPLRKIREIRYALALEKRYTKAEILERYLNISYFGAGAYGIEAASRRYFSKSASQLTLPEAATLAGLVQQPVSYDPTRNPSLSTVRRDVVLKRMAELGYITAKQRAAAVKVPMAKLLKPSKVRNGCTTSFAPFFCDYVLQVVRNDPAFGATDAEREALLKRGGLTIRTTINPTKQRIADKTVNDYIPATDKSRAATAISMVEPETGNILAMAQNRTWGTSGRGATTYNYNVDRAYGGTIGMQAGSTFKIFTLAAALEKGISPYERFEAPQYKVFKDFKNCTTGVPFGDIGVNNSTGSGTFDMRKGTAYSVNTFFYALEEKAGLCRQAEIAEEMGVRKATGDALDRVPSFPLGSLEVSPLSLAGAYAGFANHGVFCKPTAITAVTDRDGKALGVPNRDCAQVVERDVADTVTAILTGVVDGTIKGRTGQAMSLKRSAAGKTGTTNSSAAVWFAGYTPELAAAVWVGDPRGGFAHPMKDITIKGSYYSQVFGGTLPGPIWRDAMLGVLDGTPKQDFNLRSTWGLGASDWRPPPPPPPKPSRPKPTKPRETASPSPSVTDSATAPTASAAPEPATSPAAQSTAGKPTKPTSSPKPKG